MTLLIASFGASLRDSRGHVGKMTMWYQYDNTDAAHINAAYNNAIVIINAAVAMSNAALVSYNGFLSRLVSPAYGTTAQFANAEDKARLLFSMLDDDISPVETGFSRMEVPAPKLALFENDQETIKPTATLVAAFITAYLTADGSGGSAATRTGLIPGGFVGGYRQRRAFQRKITIWDKSSNLDEPEEG